MRFFRRPGAAVPGGNMTAFWSWWADFREEAAVRIEAGRSHELEAELTRHVRAVDPRLVWELAPGAQSRHALIVSPEGDPAVRPVALDWESSAPAPDHVWEYHSSRQPGSLGTLELGGIRVDLTEYRGTSSWDQVRERANVRLWHPATANASGDVPMQAAYLFLDTLLGEEAVERWIGTIDIDVGVTGGMTPEELGAEIRALTARATGDSWIVARRSSGSEEALVSVNMAVKPIDH